MTDHPEKRGDRNPLTSRKLRSNLLKNRFVPKKSKSELLVVERDALVKAEPDLPARQDDSRPTQHT